MNKKRTNYNKGGSCLYDLMKGGGKRKNAQDAIPAMDVDLFNEGMTMQEREAGVDPNSAIGGETAENQGDKTNKFAPGKLGNMIDPWTSKPGGEENSDGIYVSNEDPLGSAAGAFQKTPGPMWLKAIAAVTAGGMSLNRRKNEVASDARVRNQELNKLDPNAQVSSIYSDPNSAYFQAEDGFNRFNYQDSGPSIKREAGTGSRFYNAVGSNAIVNRPINNNIREIAPTSGPDYYDRPDFGYGNYDENINVPLTSLNVPELAPTTGPDYYDEPTSQPINPGTPWQRKRIERGMELAYNPKNMRQSNRGERILERYDDIDYNRGGRVSYQDAGPPIYYQPEVTEVTEQMDQPKRRWSGSKVPGDHGPRYVFNPDKNIDYGDGTYHSKEEYVRSGDRKSDNKAGLMELLLGTGIAGGSAGVYHLIDYLKHR